MALTPINKRGENLLITWYATGILFAIELIAVPLGVAYGLASPSFETYLGNLGLILFAGFLMSVGVIFLTRKGK